MNGYRPYQNYGNTLINKKVINIFFSIFSHVFQHKFYYNIANNW